LQVGDERERVRREHLRVALDRRAMDVDGRHH